MNKYMKEISITYKRILISIFICIFFLTSRYAEDLFALHKNLLGHFSTVASNILFVLFHFEVVIIGNQDLTDRIIGQSFHIDT